MAMDLCVKFDAVIKVLIIFRKLFFVVVVCSVVELKEKSPSNPLKGFAQQVNSVAQAKVISPLRLPWVLFCEGFSRFPLRVAWSNVSSPSIESEWARRLPRGKAR